MTTEKIAERSDIRTTARRLGRPGPDGPDDTDDIGAAWAEYQSAKSASAATFGCGSVELVLDASDRRMRAEDALDVLCEALGRSLPAARRHIDAARAAQASYVAATEHMTADIVEASNAALRLEEKLARARRGIVKVSLATRPAEPMDAAPCTEARRAERPRQRSHRRQAKATTSGDDDGGGESPGAPATLADIERLIRRLVPDLVRRELDAHAGRIAAAPTPEPPIADDVRDLVEHDVERARRARRAPGGRR